MTGVGTRFVLTRGRTGVIAPKYNINDDNNNIKNISRTSSVSAVSMYDLKEIGKVGSSVTATKRGIAVPVVGRVNDVPTEKRQTERKVRFQLPPTHCSHDDLSSSNNNNGTSTTSSSQKVVLRKKSAISCKRGDSGSSKSESGEEKSRLPALGLLAAARDADEHALREILRRSAPVGVPTPVINASDSSGRTVVSYLASNGPVSLLESIAEIPGIDINKSDNEGNTPLHFAAQAGQVECINFLLSRCSSIEVDARNNLGFTPLMKAAIQGRTKCAKLLIFAGASPTMRDSGRGLRADQWARFCGRYVCADVIEKLSRHRLLERTTSYGNWGSEPELGPHLVNGKLQPPLITTVNNNNSTGIKSKLRKAFRTSSNPSPHSFSLVTQLTSAALCASSPALPSSNNVPPVIKSLIRPLSVPKLQVTTLTDDSDTNGSSANPSETRSASSPQTDNKNK